MTTSGFDGTPWKPSIYLFHVCVKCINLLLCFFYYYYSVGWPCMYFTAPSGLFIYTFILFTNTDGPDIQKKNWHNILTLWISQVFQVMMIVTLHMWRGWPQSSKSLNVSVYLAGHLLTGGGTCGGFRLKNKVMSQQPALAVCLPANIHKQHPTVHILWTAFDTTLACCPPIVERRIRLGNLLLKTGYRLLWSSVDTHK